MSSSCATKRQWALDNDPDTDDHATHFSGACPDEGGNVHGNVNELIQEFPELVDHDQQYKHISYEYDLISGNVNQVIYQHSFPGEEHGDQFIHRYYYDADNRLTNVYTSIDSIVWEQDAKYFYYLHGPLGRSETGDVKVQGTDYAYTIHGWIKGVNSNMIDQTKDLGKDAQATNNTAYSSRAGMHSNVGLDAYGYVLGYYWDTRKDYKPINAAAQSLYTNADDLTEPNDDLFNGNIKEMSTALMMPNGTGLPTAVPLIYNQYRYDQLNRITQQLSYTGASTTDYTALSSSGDYTNTFVYDAAGNIQQQLRNGESGAGQSMDSLTYHYHTVSGGDYKANADGSVPSPATATNKLNFVDDSGTSGNYSDDLEDQSNGYYRYDEIGNLTSDAGEEILDIRWNVYGKIQQIIRTAASTKPDLDFIYDAFGNRIVKIVKPRDGSGLKDQDEWLYTYYMRDASGNVMSTYKRTYTEVSIDVVDKLQLKETHLFGSSRLGMKDRESETIFSDVTRTYSTISVGKEYIVTGVAATTAMVDPDLNTPERTLGNKQYEFSNHLGNVLVTLSDRKFAKQQGMSANVDYFTADIRSYADYSAFGVQLAGRYGGNYRYDFNGKETDAETSTQDYGMRIYNPRLGRFLSEDPLVKVYVMLSPYQYASNCPIACIDIDGLEAEYAPSKYTGSRSVIVILMDNPDQQLHPYNQEQLQNSSWDYVCVQSLEEADVYLNSHYTEGSVDNLVIQTHGTHPDEQPKADGAAICAKEPDGNVDNADEIVRVDAQDFESISDADPNSPDTRAVANAKAIQGMSKVLASNATVMFTGCGLGRYENLDIAIYNAMGGPEKMLTMYFDKGTTEFVGGVNDDDNVGGVTMDEPMSDYFQRLGWRIVGGECLITEDTSCPDAYDMMINSGGNVEQVAEPPQDGD